MEVPEICAANGGLQGRVERVEAFSSTTLSSPNREHISRRLAGKRLEAIYFEIYIFRKLNFIQRNARDTCFALGEPVWRCFFSADLPAKGRALRAVSNGHLTVAIFFSANDDE